MTDEHAADAAPATVSLTELRDRLALPAHQTEGLVSWLGPWYDDTRDTAGDSDTAPRWDEATANRIVFIWGIDAARIESERA